jgi:hypothetical protein
MLRKLLSTLTVIVASAGMMIAQNESAIKVRLTDATTKETIPFANIVVENGGIQAGIGTTNMDGEVIIKPLNPGKYNVKATYVGYQPKEISNVSVSVGNTVRLNIEMTAGQQLKEVEIVQWTVPLIDPDTKSGGTVTREEYQNMASKNINSVASTTAGVYSADEGSSLNIRGQRDNGTAYYVDGQKVIGSSGVPQGSVEQVTTIVGGVPAEYGDATGGIVAITTRGPASMYTGGVELISSGFGEKKGLDAYGYNYAGFTIMGPIIIKRDSVTKGKKSILGFSVSGEVINEKDPSPSAVGAYVINSDKLSELEQTPLRPSGTGGFVPNAEFITMNDMQKVKAQSNVTSKTLRLSGKIQYQPTTNMGITVGGSVDYNNNHSYVREYALFNPSNNPQVISNTWRAYAKLTQKFNSATTSKEEEKNQSIIKNAYFTLQASYENTHSKTQDDTHKDNVFNYGYIGKFQQFQKKSYELKSADIIYLRNPDGTVRKDTVTGMVMNGYTDVALYYTPSDVNPNGAAYTNEFYANTPQSQITNFGDVQNGLGLMNGDRPANVYSLWYNTGRQYNGYSYSDRSQFRVFANFSADIKKHAIQLGFEYEQRTERAYSLNPIGLWTQMRQLANYHLKNLGDTATLNPQLSSNGYAQYDFQRKNDGTQNQFDRSLRKALGLDPNGTDWLDIDSYDPSTFNLNMFSADDLLNLGGSPLVNYYGYDQTGKKLKGKPSLDDFFTAKDDNGNYLRQVGAYQPIYIAGYIQDKFDFKDLKFNVGLRVDRFDANQKVLKDKYLLYEAKTAGEVSSINGNSISHPGNIGSNYVVYVDNKDNPTRIVGYRDGDNWYNAQGTSLSDPSSLTGSNTVDGAINPYLVNPSDAKNKLISTKVFQDYKPQLNFMPRIAFAFPISDVANFFAHYDVLTQRPPDFNRLDPIQFLNIQNNSSFINNPDLKPERTTDYELGFAQVLSEKKNSVLTITAFYREFRNMVQAVQVYQAFPVTYNSFNNIDFGNAKGMSVAYDLRRLATGVRLTASYTLTFADGTGSSTSDAAYLASAGEPNLRITHPLDFDQRHTILLNIDYRFGAGKDYKGPMITHKKGDSNKTIKVFENVGANLVFRAGSGTPYSRQSNITQDAAFGINERHLLAGNINGSNKPWNFRMDLRIDKSLDLVWGGKKEGQEKKKASLNIYLQVLNLLNTKNVISVYRATGNPDDDGYLASSGNATSLSSRNNAQSFTDLYGIKVNNPGNYSRPRTIRIGIQLGF